VAHSAPGNFTPLRSAALTTFDRPLLPGPLRQSTSHGFVSMPRNPRSVAVVRSGDGPALRCDRWGARSTAAYSPRVRCAVTPAISISLAALAAVLKNRVAAPSVPLNKGEVRGSSPRGPTVSTLAGFSAYFCTPRCHCKGCAQPSGRRRIGSAAAQGVRRHVQLRVRPNPCEPSSLELHQASPERVQVVIGKVAEDHGQNEQEPSQHPPVTSYVHRCSCCPGVISPPRHLSCNLHGGSTQGISRHSSPLSYSHVGIRVRSVVRVHESPSFQEPQRLPRRDRG